MLFVKYQKCLRLCSSKSGKFRLAEVIVKAKILVTVLPVPSECGVTLTYDFENPITFEDVDLNYLLLASGGKLPDTGIITGEESLIEHSKLVNKYEHDFDVDVALSSEDLLNSIKNNMFYINADTLIKKGRFYAKDSR